MTGLQYITSNNLGLFFHSSVGCWPVQTNDFLNGCEGKMYGQPWKVQRVDFSMVEMWDLSSTICWDVTLPSNGGKWKVYRNPPLSM